MIEVNIPRYLIYEIETAIKPFGYIAKVHEYNDVTRCYFVRINCMSEDDLSNIRSILYKYNIV